MIDNRLPDYLEHIRQAIDDATAFVDGLTKAEFKIDKRTQQAVIMEIVIIGEAATQIIGRYPGFVANNTHIPWREMRTMRNRIAHGYFSIDLDVVWETVLSDLPDLRKGLQTLTLDTSGNKPTL